MRICDMCWLLVALVLGVAFICGWLLGNLKRESSRGPEPQHKVKERPLARPREEVGCEVLNEAGQEFYLSRSGTKVHYTDLCPGLKSADQRFLTKKDPLSIMPSTKKKGKEDGVCFLEKRVRR